MAPHTRPVQRSERRPAPGDAHSAPDITPLPDLEHGRSRTGPVRRARPVYVDLLPPCNAGCPAGENIQGWMAHVKVGEHGGDPDSISFFHDTGLDYVSCSPFRLPVARVAAAQAAITAPRPPRG